VLNLGDDSRINVDAAVGASDVRAALDEVRALKKSGLVKEALDRCRQHSRVNPSSADLLLTLARLEFDQNNPTGALMVLNDAARIAPGRIEVWVALGDGCLAARRFQAAIDAYQRAATLDSSSPEVAARLGAALQAAGRVEEAASCYRKALERSPESGLLHYNLGTALKALHRFDEAVVEYRQAVRLVPDNPDLKVRLGNLLVETSRFEQAIEPLENALSALARADQSFVCHLLAYAHKKLGQGKASVEAAKRLVDLTGGAVPALMHLSAAYLTLGDANQALTVCERGLDRAPASRQLLSDKAIALYALGRTEEASYLYDFETLLNVSRVDSLPGYENVDEFNAALMTHIRTHPTLDFSGISLSCHEGATSDELLVEPKGPVARLEQLIQQSANAFRARLCARSPHPWVDNLPAANALELSAWVTRLRSQGYQHGHIHPSAWISGVYYVSLPPEIGRADAGQSGWIEFGRPPYYYNCGQEHDIRCIQPHPGMLVLFPSYFYHRTIPFDSDEERVTIAFDFRQPAQETSATDGF
jgi:uncharacterized protein (TIGR02466 family)